jgi:ATP adenylyltransferase
MAYIKGNDRHDTCFLCDAASADPSLDETNLVVARGELVFVILNLFPYNTGHLMVAPYRHVGELDELTPDESRDVWSWTARSVDAHRATTRPDGFNIGINLGTAAGAGVPGHLHLHVVPRWSGDTNFMPVTGDTKVLPEMLADTYATLAPVLQRPD